MNIANNKNQKIFIAIFPILLIAIQFYLSLVNNTLESFFNQKIVLIADWVLIFVNFYAYNAIDWNNGKKIFWLYNLSIATSVIMHFTWQYFTLDGGHMITKSQVITPAGWLHVFFMSVEMTIMLALLFVPIVKKEYKVACYFTALYFFIELYV